MRTLTQKLTESTWTFLGATTTFGLSIATLALTPDVLRAQQTCRQVGEQIGYSCRDETSPGLGCSVCVFQDCRSYAAGDTNCEGQCLSGSNMSSVCGK